MTGIWLHKRGNEPNWALFWRDYWKHQAQPRREPAGAYDQALRRGARDQQGGRLDRTYCDATRKYLGDNGLPDEDVEAVMQILSKYTEEEPAADAENLAMREDPRVRVGGPRGTVGASDRRLALDQYDLYGRPRSLLATAMSPGGASRGFAARFPGADRIKVV